MKRTPVVATVVVAALAASGMAVARDLDGAKNARALSATFTATTASRIDTRTCTTPDNKTLVATSGTYTGTATGDADLTGAATLHTRSLINTTDGIGTVSGSLKIDVPGRDTEAQFTTVYSGGSVAGLAVGRAHSPAAQLLANISATFSTTGGFTNGKLGGSAGGAAVELAPGACRPAKPVKEQSSAHGTVTSVSSNSITVAGLTCTIPPSLQAKVAPFTMGSRAAIQCMLTNGVNTLAHIGK
jgi:hypothetical protein